MKHATMIREIKKKCGNSITLEQINSIMQGLGELVKESIHGDGEVKILGLGKFKVKEVKARTNRNPKTGGTIESPAKFKIMFHPTYDLVNYCKEAAKSL